MSRKPKTEEMKKILSLTGENIRKIGGELDALNFYNLIFPDKKMVDGSKRNKILKMEKGETITLEDLIAISRAFGVSLDSLVFGADGHKKKEKTPTIKSMLTSLYYLLHFTGGQIEPAPGYSGIRITFTDDGGIDDYNLVNQSETVKNAESDREETGEYHLYNFTSWQTCYFLERLRQYNAVIESMHNAGGLDNATFSTGKKAMIDGINREIAALPALTPYDAKEREDIEHLYDKKFGANNPIMNRPLGKKDRF